MWEWGDHATGRPWTGADLLVAEGAALFRTYGHGDRADFAASLRAAAAERTVLVNLNEHLQRLHTAELRERAAELGYELGEDRETYTV